MKIFDIFSANAPRLIDEWFKLVQWILAISALNIIGKKTDLWLFEIASYISVVLVWFYIFFSSTELFIKKTKPVNKENLKEILIVFFYATAISTIVSFFASKTSGLVLALLEKSDNIMK